MTRTEGGTRNGNVTQTAIIHTDRVFLEGRSVTSDIIHSVGVLVRLPLSAWRTREADGYPSRNASSGFSACLVFIKLRKVTLISGGATIVVATDMKTTTPYTF